MPPPHTRVISLTPRALRIDVSSAVRFPLAVCSHERSGTHFLMNSLGACTHYSGSAYVNFDHTPLGGLIDFYSQESVARFVRRIGALPVQGQPHCACGLIKSHYPAWLFEGALRQGLRVAYIWRHPVDVFVSYWRFLDKWGWLNPTVAGSPLDLCAMRPCGKSLRYQYATYDTFFDRWARHVLDWLELARGNQRVCVIRYEDLQAGHEASVRRLCTALDIEITGPVVMPSREVGVVHGSGLPLSPGARHGLAAYCSSRLRDYPVLRELLGSP